MLLFNQPNNIPYDNILDHGDVGAMAWTLGGFVLLLIGVAVGINLLLKMINKKHEEEGSEKPNETNEPKSE